MNILMMYLDKDARNWYRGFPVDGISSLKKFDVAFHFYCKPIYQVDFLLKDCCEKFGLKDCASNKDQDIFFDKMMKILLLKSIKMYPKEVVLRRYLKVFKKLLIMSWVIKEILAIYLLKKILSQIFVKTNLSMSNTCNHFLKRLSMKNICDNPSKRIMKIKFLN